MLSNPFCPSVSQRSQPNRGQLEVAARKCLKVSEDCPPTLNDRSTVEWLVWGFASKSIELMQAVRSGEVDDRVAANEITQMAEHRGRIFAGLSPFYVPVTGWNGCALADLFKKRFGFEGDDPQLVLTGVFVFLFGRIQHAFVESVAGSQAEEVRNAAERHVRYLTDLLLPNPSECFQVR